MPLESKQKVLVTGGGGFLGKAIVTLLISQGKLVFSFSRSLHPELNALGVTQIQGDLADRDAVESACKGIDTVFHVAAKPGVWGKYSQYYDTNTIGTGNIISACRSQNVARLIYTSTPGVIFNGKDMEGIDETFPYPKKFPTPYTKTKALAEQRVALAAKQGLNAIILRPHLIWGPGDPHLIPRIIARSNRLVKVGKRDNLVDTLYIDNAAHAHLLAADTLKENPGLSGKIFFISQDEPVPMWDMINTILNSAGLSPIRRSMPYRVVWLIGAFLELFHKVCGIDSEPLMTRFVAGELGTSHWFDISAAKRDLGYFPLVSTREGFSRLKEWFKTNPPSLM